MIEANEVNGIFYALRILSHGLDISQIQVTVSGDYPSSEFTKAEQEQALAIIHGIEDLESVTIVQLPQDKVDSYKTSLADRIEKFALRDLASAGYTVETTALVPSESLGDQDSSFDWGEHVIQAAKEIELLAELSPSSERFAETVDHEPETTSVQTADERRFSISELTERLKRGKPEERAATLKELGQLDGEQAFGLVTQLFDDESMEVRSEAARCLYELNVDRAGSFTRALREASPERRRNIGMAMETSGLAHEAISKLAGQSREEIYDAFSILFLMAKTGHVHTLLTTIENHPNVAVRLSAIKLLTFAGQTDIFPELRRIAAANTLPIDVRSALLESIYSLQSSVNETSRSVA